MMQIQHGLFGGAWAERDGRTFARKIDGKWALCPVGRDSVMRISREQAFALWDKHFNGRACWELPFFMEAATDAGVKYVYYTSSKILYVEMEER